MGYGSGASCSEDESISLGSLKYESIRNKDRKTFKTRIKLEVMQFKQAASIDAEEINNLAYYYLNGIGVKKDENKAFIYYSIIKNLQRWGR
ncbi:hypothetical protein F8M41_016682 [Gigaspora margarita]|uniref:SEL1-like repeat protein n=2 Tax=Gigaspora margarita TaxID=4874 RepID=A0A8H4EMQ8_GIGMA|nr:hypothetical protein F8M41_016682 [Gigaspora margarita]